MSIGIYAIAKKSIEYKNWVFYTYAGEDWNIQPTQNGDVRLQDGSIVIWKYNFRENYYTDTG